MYAYCFTKPPVSYGEKNEHNAYGSMTSTLWRRDMTDRKREETRKTNLPGITVGTIIITAPEKC